MPKNNIELHSDRILGVLFTLLVFSSAKIIKLR